MDSTMNVQRVEYSKINSPYGDGIRVTFTYGGIDWPETFDIVGEPDASMVWNMIGCHPDPLHLLVALHRMANITVH